VQRNHVKAAALDLNPAPDRRDTKHMMTRDRQPRKPMRPAVEMAISAVENSPLPSPLDDPEMAEVNPDPGSLDLTPDSWHAPGLDH